MIDYFKAVTEAGGAIDTQIASGVVGALLPKITQAEQVAGIVISKKFYLKNNEASPKSGFLELEAFTTFSAIIFEGTGSAQVVGDLTGSEVNETPIAFSLAVGEEQSYWLQITVPALSAETANYNTVTTNLNF